MSESDSTDNDGKEAAPEEPKRYVVPRNPDGTFVKGHSGFPGGAMRLSSGQKIVRDFSIKVVERVMEGLWEMFLSPLTSPELKVKIGEIIVYRAAGKVQEAPAEDNGMDGGAKSMSGAQLTEAVAFIRQNQHLFQLSYHEGEKVPVDDIPR
jgi:hypothetical protein